MSEIENESGGESILRTIGDESEIRSNSDASDHFMDGVSYMGEDESELSENNIMTTAASDITYVFKITGNGDEKKVTLKKIEVNPISNVEPANSPTEKPNQISNVEPANLEHRTKWVAYVDDDSQNTYYLNTETGKTQWDKPEDFDESGELRYGGSKHRRTRKKRKKKKKSRKKK